MTFTPNPAILTPGGRGLGLLWQGGDRRDMIFSASPKTLESLSDLIDLRPKTPPIWDQGPIGSCVAHGTGGGIQYAQMQQGLASFEPSRLALYYWTRLSEGTQQWDSGCEIRDAIKVAASKGVCPETEWSYNVNLFNQAPPSQCETDAIQHLALQYEAVPLDLDQIRACLAEGFPVVIGLTLYESFESAQVETTGVVPMPGLQEQIIGGHCMLIVGYRNSDSMFIVRNSWGTNFGDQGHVYIPYLYITNPNLGSDYWKISLVE